MLITIECGLVVLALLTALAFPRLGEPWISPLEHRFAWLARKRHLSVVAVGVTALALRVLLLPILPVPDPAVHDEFSYLLAADTFAHGRLANPTHPMWIHFETFHEIQKPAYASMYYPAQGLFLALGQVVFRHPYWGVWLSTGLMCGAICWMLQGWLPPIWALLGGLLAVIRLGTFSYWTNSYWGGAVAALGGALILGAFPRIQHRQMLSHVLLMGIGFALLANSRPYEGLFFSVPLIAALVIWMRNRRAPPLRLSFFRVLLPLGILFILTATAMGYYFWRTTGSPFRTPFQVNVSTYNPVPYFPWQTVRAIPAYHHEVMRNFYLEWWMRQYTLGRSHPIVLLLVKVCTIWFFFLGPLLSLPLVVSCLLLPYGFSPLALSRRTRLLLIVCASILLGSLLPVYLNAHYIAATTCAIYAIILIAMQKVRRWKPKGRPAGIALVRSVPLVAVLMLILGATAPAIRNNHVPPLPTWYSPLVQHSYRGDIISKLSNDTGLHLVIVRYSPDHVPINEWVFNKADIDHSRVIWARDMGAERNSELIHYFRGRRVWIINPDKLPPKLSEYDLSADTNQNGVSSDPQAPLEGVH